MTSIELSNFFEKSYNDILESQKEEIRNQFSSYLDQIRRNKDEIMANYSSENFAVTVTLTFNFSIPKEIAKWAYDYFEEMSNVVVLRIFTGISYIRLEKIDNFVFKRFLNGTEEPDVITEIKLNIYL